MQKNSYLTFETNLDGNVPRCHKFDVRKLSGEERLSDDFEYQLELTSLERLSQSDISKLVGSSATIKIGFKDRSEKQRFRYVNGIVFLLKEIGVSKPLHHPEFWHYTVTIRSWLHELSAVKDCRVIQKGGNTAQSILSDLLNELGLKDYRFDIGKLERHEYATIYNESLLNFIKRICYRNDLLFYFEHTQKRHTLVFLSDSRNLPVLTKEEMGGRFDAFTQICREGYYLPVKNFQNAAYNWESPPVKNIQKTLDKGDPRLKSYDYSNGFSSRSEGERKTENQLRTIENSQKTFSGESTQRGLRIGYRYKFDTPRLPELENKSWLITELKTEADISSFKNTFSLVAGTMLYFGAADDAFHIPIVTGLQTATVVGSDTNAEPVTDDLGRVKIHFNWDHHHHQDVEKSSAFVRVGSTLSGATCGHIFTPRVGEEVAVLFENGSPEKPIIIGSVYSNERKPPTQPGMKPYTSLIKTHKDSDANSILFNDRPGSQSLDLNAKKDLNINVGGNLTVNVEDSIKVEAKKVNVIIRKNVKVKAGGNILNLTLSSINNTAGADINNIALGGIVDAAGGLINNLAGATIVNTALIKVDKESEGEIINNADTVLVNLAANAVASTGKNVKVESKLATTNISSGGYMKDSKNVKSKALFTKKEIGGVAANETGKFNVKGLMSKIN